MWRNHKYGLLLALVCAATGWFYATHVLVPYQKAFAAIHNSPRGNLSDLYPRWLGARELLLHKRDPYSKEITREIQIGYYGRALDPNIPSEPVDQEGFAYPLYVVFLLAPTVTLQFSVLQTGFYWFLVLIVGVELMLWFKALQLRPEPMMIVIAGVIIYGCFPVIQGLALCQLSVVVSGLLASAFFLIVRQKFLLAGVVLAIATIKPQLVVPLLCWLTLWTLSDWHKRKGFLFGFVSGMTVLFVAAEWALPGWIGKFYSAVVAYWGYTRATTPADALFGPIWGKIVNILLVLVVAFVCWRLRRENETSLGFCFVVSFVLAATVAIIPTFAPYNQLLLFPSYLFLIQHRSVLVPPQLWQKILLGFAVLVLCWQWIACIFLTLVSLLVSKDLAESMWRVPFYASIPLPIVLMCLLYVCVATMQSDLLRLQKTNSCFTHA